MRFARFFVTALAFALIAVPCKAAQPANVFSHLEFRNIGPTTGRLDAVSGVAGDPTTYFAAGLGGLWRTQDGGVHWSPVFDDKPVTSIGAITVAPSNRSIVYLGTGEPNIRNDIAFGDGVWRSSNGGSTWTHMGLDGTSQIAQIAVDPRNADIVYVAAVGDPFEPGTARGLYKSTDGGRNWRRVLFLNGTTGASSVVISPRDPRTVFAGMWTVQRRPWMLTSGGPADGLYRSSDAGMHWTRVRGNGFAAGLTGRIGLSFAPSDARRLYAVIESKSGVFWSSNDGGTHWTLVNDKHVLDQRPYYFSQFTVDPKNAKHLFFMSIVPSESRDGGKTIKRMQTEGYDHHQMWIDPVRGKRAIIAADAGVRLSLDGGKTWRDPQLIVSQPYHISVDHGTPYTICGEFQDPGAVCGPSISFTGAITPDQWFSAQSGESGWIVFSPANENIIYGTGYQAAVLRFDKQAMQGRLISPWPDTYAGTGAASYKYRGAWVAPVAVSPLEPNALYFGAQTLMRTDDGGQTWREVSPDLTRNDKSKQQPSGRPITVDNAGTEVYDTIASIAESPRVKGEIWVGTDDGLVWVTRDGGARWSNVTAGIPNLPQWARINNVDPSPFADGTAYIAAENHKLGDRAPYLYVTHDFGAHWSAISSGLPRNSYTRMLREDPFRKDMLYAGTENALWLSFDGGAHWQTLLNNLAHLPIYDFIVQPKFDDLVVATHGRGVWILDDISPLQAWSSSIARSASYLFPVRDAYRWNASWGTWATNEGAGDNPAGIADINFYLRDKPSKKSNVKVLIYDGKTLIRSLDVKHPRQGIDRIWWDLNYEEVKPVRDYHATRTGFTGPQALPGTYTVRLNVDGRVQDRTIKLLPDPKTPGTQADMRAAFGLAMRLRSDYARAGNEIVALRSLHGALASVASRARSHADTQTALASLQRGVDRSLDAMYIGNAQTWEDTLRTPPGIYERILNAAGGIIGNDYRPTNGQAALAAQVESDLNALLASDNALFGPQLANLNVLLKRDGIPPLSVKR